ncbi:unnamed protein product [Ceutorhynchus assimilis]|uniref:CHK kinase-like domain-containing protein n=1 Tax=Ceutorhynchus assimilis TaxID=467358 RepID=A0A9N9MBN5_9CUCU|nr:unnamed protein product [Ceutorhynchus assimilis]
MLEEHLKFIKEAALLNGIEDFELQYENGKCLTLMLQHYQNIFSDSEPGGNYFGIITKFIVKHGNTRLQLVLKKASLNQEARQKRAILPAFEREYELYNNVLPELMKFQIAHSVSKKFTALPKYYNGTNENEKEAILMEDLNAAGFRLWKRLEPMDFEHMSLIFQEYAKLHAISLALRHKQPKAFENLTENIKLNFLKQREVKMPAHYKHMRQVVLEKGAQAVLGNAKAQRCYNQFQNAYWQYLDEDQENPENDILVVSHGDCHPDNILFKYDEITAKPKELRFIDWQLSSTESPINDISFVLFTCAGEDVLSRCEELFQIYHGTIEENLTEFGCDSDEVFGYKSFAHLWNKHFLHGLYRAQVCLKLFLITPKEIADLGESTSILDILKADLDAGSLFSQRMKGLFEIVGNKWLK